MSTRPMKITQQHDKSQPPLYPVPSGPQVIDYAAFIQKVVPGATVWHMHEGIQDTRAGTISAEVPPEHFPSYGYRNKIYFHGKSERVFVKGDKGKRLLRLIPIFWGFDRRVLQKNHFTTHITELQGRAHSVRVGRQRWHLWNVTKSKGAGQDMAQPYETAQDDLVDTLQQSLAAVGLPTGTSPSDPSQTTLPI